MKAGREARVRARKEKEKEREEKEHEEKREEDERENDFEGWSNRLRVEQAVCLILFHNRVHLIAQFIVLDDTHQRPRTTKSSLEQPQKCCFSSSDEKHRQSSQRRSCTKKETQGWRGGHVRRR